MYSQVSKYPGTQKKMQYRSKGKGCGYYMRIVFFFSSLIQSLIIVSLVLFLVYGKRQDSASVSRIHDLEESFSRLSIENVALRQQRKNLTNLLNTTLVEKARNDWDLANLRYHSNISMGLIKDMEKRMQSCNMELMICRSQIRSTNGQNLPCLDKCNCPLLVDQLRAKLELVESNFTQTAQRMRMEMDQIAKDRDNINLEAIHLRRDKSTHEKEVEYFRQKCKDDFAQSLSGVSSVSTAFLEKIDSLFPSHIAFQLTCPKQREHLEQIRTNCSSLSREVEDRFQRYLNSVGEQVSSIQGHNSRLKAENWRISEDYRSCSHNRTGMIQQHRQSLEKLQLKHDQDKEKLLMDKLKLHGEIDVLENNVKYKSKEAAHLTEQIKQLNMSCMSKTGFGGLPGASPSRTNTGGFLGGGGGGGSSSSSTNQFGRTGSGGLGSSFVSPFNKPASAGTGSLLSSGSSSSSGSAYNKPASTGGASSHFGSTGSNPNGLNKPTSVGKSTSAFGSTGSSPNLNSGGLGSIKPPSVEKSSSSFGSTGSSPNLNSGALGLNKPTSVGKSSSSFGSAFGSTGSSSSGIGSNKPTSVGKSSTGYGSSASSSGSSSGSTGSTSKSGSTNPGFSWLGFGNSNADKSKPDSGTGRGTSSGSSGGSGSLGAGRTSGSVSVAQHLRDLQRLINPNSPEEKQDLSRMLG